MLFKLVQPFLKPRRHAFPPVPSVPETKGSVPPVSSKSLMNSVKHTPKSATAASGLSPSPAMHISKNATDAIHCPSSSASVNAYLYVIASTPMFRLYTQSSPDRGRRPHLRFSVFALGYSVAHLGQEVARHPA